MGTAGKLSAEVEAWMESGYLGFRLARCHPQILNWQGREATRANLQRSLTGELKWLNDESTQNGYSARCPVEGATPPEYGIRFLNLAGWGSLLAGIHFYSLDLARPFVHVSAMDFDPDARGVEELRRLLAREFAVFQPRWFRIWLDGEESPLTALPGAWIDSWFVAGALGEIRRLPRPRHHDRISLVADAELDSFSAFEDCYREYLAGWLGAEAWLEPGERELMEACAKAGAHYRVHIDGEPAGWIAARKDEAGPLAGWAMADELLEPPFRGHGFAAAMQRAFLDTLPADDLVWGTIDSRNLPSLATARRVGREIVCAYLFLPFS